VIVADTSGLLPYFDQSEPRHEQLTGFIDGQDEQLVVSPYVVAELDYLVSSRQGLTIELTVLRALASGAYELAQLSPTELAACADVIERYSDQDIGVTDASLVVLARRYETRRILTLDHRHFDVLRPLTGGRFQVVPG
jgi:uncharacterized protein